jgi:hypothetical protein
MLRVGRVFGFHVAWFLQGLNNLIDDIELFQDLGQHIVVQTGFDGQNVDDGWNA